MFTNENAFTTSGHRLAARHSCCTTVPCNMLTLSVSTSSKRYRTALPDAYERLILDVINGDKRLFIRNDELEVQPS